MRKTSKYIALILICVVALALRIYFLFKPGFTNDISLFVGWGERIAKEGLATVYGSSGYSQGIDYPFLVPYLASFFVKATRGLTQDTQYMLFKLPATVFELGLIIASLIVVIKSKAKYKWFLFALIAIQPALALVSSAWGQIDSIFSTLLLLGFLLSKKNDYLGPVLIFAAVMIKPQAAIGLVIYLVYLIGLRDWKRFLRQLVVFVFLTALLFFFFKAFSDINLIEPYTKSVGRYENVTLNAFNLWWLVFGRGSWEVKDTLAQILSYRQEGTLLFGIFALPALAYLLSKKRTPVEGLLALSYVYLIFFVFPTEIHERYMYPAVALMGITATLNWRIFLSFIVLTFTFIANVFAVLQSVYPQFPFLRFDLLSGPWTQGVAFINLVIVVVVMIYVVNECFSPKKIERQ